jgi:hypothetical protein
VKKVHENIVRCKLGEMIMKKTVKSATGIIPHIFLHPQESEMEKILPFYCVT